MQLDLNLLTALDALLEEGSVAHAAERLKLSQPAMSRTLARIRKVTGDPIMIRTGHRMVPTTYALSIREEVHAIVRQGKKILMPSREMDLATLQRTFTICANEVVLTTIASQLIEKVHERAPGIKLRFLSEGRTDTDDLHHGQVDLEISGGSAPSADLCHEVIYRDRLAVAVRWKHAWTRGRFTAKRFAQCEHVIISRRGRLRDGIDARLEAMGLSRKVSATLPTTWAALNLIVNSDCAAVVLKKMCGDLSKLMGFRLLDLPFEIDPIPLHLTWHRRYEEDAVHRWIRGEVKLCPVFRV